MQRLLTRIFVLLLITGTAWARDAREDKRIEHLLHSVESLKGEVFIRNGTHYDAIETGKHLRMKLRKAGERVKTAEAFIEACASRSSLSGEAYKIKMPGGKMIEAAEFFRARLREFDDSNR